MHPVRSTKAYQHVSNFDEGRIIAYRDCGLSNRSTAACVGRDPVTISRVWNQWILDDNTECRAGSQRPTIISS
ncbi:HTH_Tnp_Tc3_2 domain-containing protein [Trichonephila clavipes]|nr:HTH_Tnp_Tc3_2 domain-containing protein [Trichonephila clavipes]